MGFDVRAPLGLILAGCLAATLGGCHDGDQSSTATSDTAGATAGATAATATPEQVPTISGSSATAAVVGTAYSFTPTASSATGAKLTFSVANAPAWTSFDPTDGKLSGTPAAANVGSSGNIVISVTDGVQSASLPGFSIAVTEPTSVALTISGSPAVTASVGAAYSFKPTSVDASGASLTYTIANKPVWATFDATSGALSGTPGVSNVGTMAQIDISVSDGTHSASLPAFSITVASAPAESVTLAWMPPTLNADGTPITNLAGYRVYYGSSAKNLNEVVDVNSAGDTQQVIANLTTGTWYFAVASVNTEKVESALSAVVSFDI